MGMWVYVHTFPDGYRPQPKVVLGAGARGPRREDRHWRERDDLQGDRREGNGPDDQRPDRRGRQAGGIGASMTIARQTTLPPRVGNRDRAPSSGCWPRTWSWPDTNQPDKFGVEGVPVVLMPGVKVEAADVHADTSTRPSSTRPHQVHRPLREGQADGGQHVQRLLDAHGLRVGADRRESVHRAQAGDGVQNLVMGLTPLPDDGPCPWYKHPYSGPRPSASCWWQSNHFLVKVRTCMTSIKSRSGSSSADCC